MMHKQVAIMAFLVLLVPASAFGYPVEYEDEDLIIRLGTPDYYITTSNFDEQEITVNVTFENSNSDQTHGLIWEIFSIANTTLSYDEIYEQEYEFRTITVLLNDITDGTKVNLDDDLLKINSDYNLRILPDHNYNEYLPLEILDIEQNVVGSHDKKSTLEFEFTIYSPEFELGEKYELDLSTGIGGSNLQTFEFVDRSEKEYTPPTSDTPVSVETDEEREAQNESNFQAQQLLQQQQAIEDAEKRKELKRLEEQQELEAKQTDSSKIITAKMPEEKPVTESSGLAPFVESSKDPQHYVDRYNNEPNYKAWFDENYPEYDSIYDAVGLEPTNKTPTVKPVIDSEPTSKEITCGKGMIPKDGICVFAGNTDEPQCGRGMVVENGICVFDKKESTGFFDSIFSVFSGLFK